MPITLRELKKHELTSIYPLIKQLNPELKKPAFEKRLKAMLPLGYRVVAVYDGKRMVALSGFWIGMRFWCGKQFDIDNFVVDESYRGKGVGKKLSQWLEKKAIDEACDLMVLDAYSSNSEAHRFYHRVGFVITGYHFTKRPGSPVPFTRSEAHCDA